MTKIKLENGTGIEVTKQGLLIKGKSIQLKIGDSDIVAVIGDDGYSLTEQTSSNIIIKSERFEQNNKIAELQYAINELKTQVTTLASTAASKNYVAYCFTDLEQKLSTNEEK